MRVEFNAERSRAAIRRAMATVADMTPVYQDIGEYLIEEHRQRFVQGVDPDGNPWAAKSPATIERYKRLGYGALNRPLIGAGKRLSREIQKFVSRDGVVIGSSLIYSGTMQEGAAKGAFGSDRHGRPLPWGRIPARRWLGLSNENETGIIEIVEEHETLQLDARD